MEHVVFFPAPDGTPAFRRFAGLDDAVRFVEHLRNVENVSGASVHALTEVPLAFKAWYRVEVPADQAPSATENHEPVGTQASSEQLMPAPAAASAEQAPRPATVAETIETYTQAPRTLDVPEVGSGTGIVVPDQPLVAIDQFGLSPLPAPEAPARPEATPQGEAQVLEPAFGTRRERGMGFFAR